tara:strand:+ start:183 stop:758 length:576 start_codon:yes stop_codon:yes gene_type:complete
MTSFVFSQKGERSQIIIPPKQIVQINYPMFKGFYVKIWNKSKLEILVSSRVRDTDSLLKSLILEKGSSSVLEVKQGSYLQLENKYYSSLKLEYIPIKEAGWKRKSQEFLTPQRSFYLENNTAQSIPLRIPGIMNPSLSPFSRSGVDLPNGQKVYLDLNGKYVLILTVTDSIYQGARIDIATLINKAINHLN